MSKIRLFTLTFVWCFLSIFSIYGDNISRTPDSILFQQKEKQSRKRMPPRYMSYLTYYDGEACFLNKIFLYDELNIINTRRNNI